MKHKILKRKVSHSFDRSSKTHTFFHYVAFISLIFTYGSAYVNMNNQGIVTKILEKTKLLLSLL